MRPVWADDTELLQCSLAVCCQLLCCTQGLLQRQDLLQLFKRRLSCRQSADRLSACLLTASSWLVSAR